MSSSELRSSSTGPARLLRRGFDLGLIGTNANTSSKSRTEDWARGTPILLKQICTEAIAGRQKEIERSDTLYQSILAGELCDSLLAEPPYAEQLEVGFEALGSSKNEGDDQEIETVLFDAIDELSTIAEDLWIKVSWLSFNQDDASLRFRFSFGEDFAEDVAADPLRQEYSARLCEVVFPESDCITENPALSKLLDDLLQSESVKFVERIVYFNAPNGGAYLHHDRERGHAGVVYAQLSGETFWLALSKQALITEVCDFIRLCERNQSWPANLDATIQKTLKALAADPELLATELESFANDALIRLINEEQGFVQTLIKNGHGRHVKAGDVLLLSQESEMSCCWHSVFCLGNDAGQALSFAIRRD